MPSSPSLQAWPKTVGPSPSMWLVEPDAGPSSGQDGRERGLTHLQRIASQVVAVELDQVEGVEEHAGFVAA
jgi:hypothetical protein